MHLKKNPISLVVGLALALGCLSASLERAEAAVSSSDLNNQSLNLGLQGSSYGITIAAASATNVAVAIDISQSDSVALFMFFTGDGTETAKGLNAVCYPSLDGTQTNADLAHPIQLTNTFSSLKQICASTNLPANAYGTTWPGIGGYRFLYMDYITNASGTVNATNVSLVVPYKTRKGLRGTP